MAADIPCIKGAEDDHRFDRCLETKLAAIPYNYLPSERQEQKTSVKVAITRDGGDTGFQGSGSMATGNAGSSGSHNSDNQQTSSEGDQLPQSTACEGTKVTSGSDCGSPNDPLAGKADTSSAKADPLPDETNEPNPSSRQPGLDEQLPEPTTREDDTVRPGDTLSPYTILAEDAVPSGKEPCAEREAETNPPNKLNKAVEAEQHFCADQASPADIVADSKGQADVSCNGKVEHEEKGMAERVNESNDERKEGMHKGKTPAEDAEKPRAAGKDQTKAKGKAGDSQPKRSAAVGLSSVAKVLGATAKKQQSTSATPESDSRKDNTDVASRPEAEQPAANAMVGAAVVGEPPPVPPWQWVHVEDAQDWFTITNDCAGVIVEGQLVQTLMVHMEPHDVDLPPPSHPPAEESERGRGEPTQLATSHLN